MKSHAWKLFVIHVEYLIFSMKGLNWKDQGNYFVSVIYLGCDSEIKLPPNLKLLLIYDIFDVEWMKNTL